MSSIVAVGIDGSAPSATAANWAAQFAERMGAPLSLVHVIDDEWGIVGHDAVDEIEGEAAEILETELARLTSLVPGLRISTELRRGDPVWELVDVSANAALVVVGTHKTGFIRGRLFGTRGLRLADNAPGPVALVPESSARSRRGIVVGIAGEPSWDGALRFAAAEAHRTGQDLVLVRAWGEGPSSPPESPLGTSSRDAVQAAARDLEEAVSLVRRHLAGLTIRMRSINRSTAEALLDASATARLLAIDRLDGESGAGRLGAIGHDILPNLTGPTVIVPSRAPRRPSQPKENQPKENQRGEDSEGTGRLRVDVRQHS